MEGILRDNAEQRVPLALTTYARIFSTRDKTLHKNKGTTAMVSPLYLWLWRIAIGMYGDKGADGFSW